MAKVLLVEDDPIVLKQVHDWLQFQHFNVDTVDDGAQALERLRFYKYDIIVLDWGLPGLSGIDVCRQFRQSGGFTPILMLTGKMNVEDKEDGLDAGADDYLTKPFHIKELSARIRALLRRPKTLTDNVLCVGHLTLELASYRLLVQEQEVQLAPLEFALLEFLMRHPNQVFSSEALLNHVWGNESDAAIDTLRTYIKTLRKKIDIEGQTSAIKTIHGIGYKLEAEKTQSRA